MGITYFFRNQAQVNALPVLRMTKLALAVSGGRVSQGRGGAGKTAKAMASEAAVLEDLLNSVRKSHHVGSPASHDARWNAFSL